jgi:hypothetical protein
MSSSNLPLLETTNQSGITQFRITTGGRIETRNLKDGPGGSTWREASPAQLSHHVMKNTIVARWLEQNLGWRRLLRACVGLEPAETCQKPDHRSVTENISQGVLPGIYS